MTLDFQPEHIVVNDADGILSISLNRPEKRNAITSQMIAEMICTLDHASNDPSVRVIVVKGTGKGFCPGDDLGGMGHVPSPLLQYASVPITHAGLQQLIRELPKPVIAAVHGYAFGVGLDLAMACDFRIVSDDIVLQDQRVMARGMHALTGCAWFHPRVMGITRAMAFLVLGEPMDAETAVNVGMVTSRCPADALAETTDQLAHRLAGAPTKAIGLMKHQIHTGIAMDHPEFMSYVAPLMQSVTIRDREEGIAAFLEKRPPQFTGE